MVMKEELAECDEIIEKTKKIDFDQLCNETLIH